MLICCLLISKTCFSVAENEGAFQRASKGSVEDQMQLADLFFDGENYHEAMKCYSKLAEQENAKAQRRIGWMHSNGKGVPQNYSDAMKWYQKAARNGDVVAQNNIGALFKDGLGVSQNYSDAMNWFQKAAGRGYELAQINVATMYEKGLGVPQDYSSAFKLYIKLARQNNYYANYKVGFYLQNGLGTEKNIKLAIGWYRKAADAEHVDSLLALGWICLKGLDDEPNYNAALIWYFRAANLGNPAAQNMLGYLYESGLGAQQDINQAITWYKLAAKNGNKEAKSRLIDITNNNLNSHEKFLEAASKGDADAMYNLAISYDNGTAGTEVDHVIALEWYIKAARKKGSVKEVYNLELRQKLYSEDFDSLEEIAKDLRQKQTKAPSGVWQLAEYYDVISQPMGKNRDKNEHWKYLLDKIQKWNKVYPNSITAHITLAEFYTESPVMKTADSISIQDFDSQSFASQSTAENILSEAHQLSERCPHWYAVMLKVANRQGWEESRLDGLFNEAIKFEPTYLAYYAVMVENLSYRWSDSNKEWVAFANKVENLFGGHEGLAVFSHISWLALYKSGNAFKFMQNNHEVWNKIKQGFEYREQIYGSNNYDLNRFCYMAVFVNDDELSRKLFNRIGNDWSNDVFPSKENFVFLKSSVFK